MWGESKFDILTHKPSHLETSRNAIVSRLIPRYTLDSFSFPLACALFPLVFCFHFWAIPLCFLKLSSHVHLPPRVTVLLWMVSPALLQKMSTTDSQPESLSSCRSVVSPWKGTACTSLFSARQHSDHGQWMFTIRRDERKCLLGG